MCAALSTIPNLSFTGLSDPTLPVSQRLFDESMDWTLTGICDAAFGDVTIGGSGLDVSSIVPCAQDGTFSLSIANAAFDSSKHPYGRRTITASQGGGSASTTLIQSNSAFTVWEVRNASELQAMQTGNENVVYVLTADIDLATVSATNNWTPLSDFRGILEGNGHTISNLNVTATTQAGFLTSAFQGGSGNGAVQNLNFNNASVTATTGRAGVLAATWSVLTTGPVTAIYNVHATNSAAVGVTETGGLVGYVEHTTTLSDVSFMGTVSSGTTLAGGIIGSAIGAGVISLLEARFTGSVTGILAAGGIAGFLRGNLTKAVVAGNVTGGDSTGGALGSLDLGDISLVDSNMTVVGTTATGGLVGYCSGCTVINNRVRGSVTGTNYVGGITGETSLGTVRTETNTVTVDVTGTGANVGPMLGFNAGTTLTNYRLTSAICSGCNNAFGTATSAAQFIQQSNLPGLNFTTIWTMVDGVSRPTLLWLAN